MPDDASLDPGGRTPPAPASDAPAPAAAAAAAPRTDDRPRLGLTPSERMKRDDRRRWLATMLLRVTYLTILVVVSLLPFVGEETESPLGGDQVLVSQWLYAFLATFAFGAAVLIVDSLLPNKRLATVFAIYFGLVAGLVAALALGTLVDLIADSWYLTESFRGYILLVKLSLGITLCYLAVSVVLTTREDLRLVIPYVEFKREIRGLRPVLLDTSILIDGRIEPVVETGFIDAPLIVPQFVVDELQTLADLPDRTRRARGRRGLDVLKRMQAEGGADLVIDGHDPGGTGVDSKLLQLAQAENYRVLTTDYNLNKVAQIHGVTVLNLNDLAGELKAPVIAGDELEVDIRKPGENPGQGVGYLPDGTMVVVEEAGDHVGATIPCTVTNSLQTSAGRMVFAKLDRDRLSAPAAMAEAARAQPTAGAREDRPARRPAPSGAGRRNPRRT